MYFGSVGDIWPSRHEVLVDTLALEIRGVLVDILVLGITGVLVATLVLGITGVLVDTLELEVEKVLVDLVLILALFLFWRSLISFSVLLFSSRKIEISFLALATFSFKFSFLVFKLLISRSLVFNTLEKESSSFFSFSDSTFKLLENALKSVASFLFISLASFNCIFTSIMSSISTLAFSSFKLSS